MDITIKFNTDHISAEDSDMIFIGSGALSYSWYRNVKVGDQANGSDWWVTFTDPEDSKIIKTALYHDKILAAVKTILETESGLGVSSDCYQQCVYLVTNVDHELVDFDADTADQVMQVAAFGKVIYG